MRLNLRMILLIAFSVLTLLSTVLIRWVLSPEKTIERIQKGLGTNVISAAQKLISTEDRKSLLNEGSKSKGMPRVEGISRALLGRDNPFEPLSEVPKNLTPTPPPSESGKVVRTSSPPAKTSTRSTTSGSRSQIPSTSPGRRELSPPKIELKGVLIGNPKMAILDIDGSTAILAEGESIGDIQVADIEDEKVTLSYKGREISLKMQEIPIQQVKGR